MRGLSDCPRVIRGGLRARFRALQLAVLVGVDGTLLADQARVRLHLAVFDAHGIAVHASRRGTKRDPSRDVICRAVAWIAEPAFLPLELEVRIPGNSTS